MEDATLSSTGLEPAPLTKPTEPVSPTTKPEEVPESEPEPGPQAEPEPEPEPEPDTDAEAETPKMAHDSMVTVRLSEPENLTLDTGTTSCGAEADTSQQPENSTPTDTESEHDNNSDIDGPGPRDTVDMSRHSTTASSRIDTARSLQDELGECEEDDVDSDSSEELEEVNWEELEKTEDEQTKDEETDNSTALLLARLEQENAKLATNPKTVKVQAVEKLSSSKSRPPSMAQLRQMMSGPTPTELRYSMLPPPPMTDLEFYAALVKDYQQTAARLPTLLSNKIRKGIPPPLRGVIWQSMSSARDAHLEERFDQLCGESSPYEMLIGKDLGRSFPGVDMFRDPDGDGQRMLGHVLKCFSLFDTKIGYCQGLAFLVGPLLMHMPDKQAFCVLVRLMERYDLRSCFLPDLSGLHVRIYQFRELLRHHFPALSNHLDELQVETAYVSQWFLSFFAVTCPLPMLFRIYDVVFAEGASETLMRVALSLMKKNEARLLACVELEDVMQLLLSRGLWDCYHYDADEFVQDFVGLTGIVTREVLAQLEQSYRESLIAQANAARPSDVTTAASRFLGRIWATSNTNSTKTATLAPGSSAPGKQFSILRRSTSKQSLASTLNSIEASSASIASSTSTEGTSMSRDSANAEDDTSSRESTPVGPKTGANAKNTEDRYLHSQIEDLLTALSELQRSHALVTNQLQHEKEEREEDRRAVRSLLDGLRKRAISSPTVDDVTIEGAVDETSDELEAVDLDENDSTPLSDKTETPVLPEVDDNDGDDSEAEAPSQEDLSELLDRVETRFAPDEGQNHRSSMMLTKSQLREELAQAKAELANAIVQCQDLNRRIHGMDQEMASAREQLKDRHNHVRTLHQEKQRLEKQVQGLRKSSGNPAGEVASKKQEAEVKNCKGSGAVGGLRELKLGRSQSTPSTQDSMYNKRISSLPQPNEMLNDTPPSEHEALLLELVQAKTAEAMAKQEADEAKQKLEALRKTHGIIPGGDAATAAATGASIATGAIGVFGRLTGHAPSGSTDADSKVPTSLSASVGSAASGGFWGWRR